MNRIYRFLFFSILSIALVSCASKRKKDKEASALGKFYHNTTALYNGYFNANELMEKSYLTLQASHQDNYNEILPLYDYVAVSDPKIVANDLDKAIEKVTKVAALHEPSKWVDDCYVLMGEAQYLKQEYESAEETFGYFKNEFNPSNPFGRNYKKKKKSKKAIKKERDQERKEEKKAKDEEKKKQKEIKEEERKAREKAKKEADELRKKEREAKKKAREEEKKRKKKKRRKGGKKKREVVKDEKVDETKDSNTKPPETELKEEKTPDVKEIKEEVVEEEETVDIEKKKEDKKVDKTAYPKGLIWYAKTLVKREKLANASYLLNRMKDEGGIKKDVAREIPVILADINILEKNYTTAINHLDDAIELANDRNLKARYAFVQGQLELQNKNYASASESFAKSKKWAKTFEMEFQADLNTEKTQMMSGGKSRENVASKMDKMAKQEKYAEYLAEIYYTKGEILLADNNFDEALKSFSKSIKNNNNNIPLKQETYYKLARLFYDKEAYVEANNYYDSTLQVIDKEDKRYNEVSRYSENLTDIAKNIELIAFQDSMYDMSSWDDEKITKLAERLVEEAEEAAARGEKVADIGTNSTALMSGTMGGFKTSAFFAYDPMQKQRGKKDFEKKWGIIDLEDDWRRQDKSSVLTGGEDESDEDKVAEDGFEEDPVTKMISNIKSNIPYSDEAKAMANAKIEEALHELGKDFRDKIQNFEKAAESLEELLERYPDTDKKLDSYYYLYLTYLDLNNTTKANYYKNKLLAEFPDTEYAKAISDPNYAANNLSKEQQIEKYYEDTYEYFTAGEYKKAYEHAKNSKEIFGNDNILKAKFDLVKAMATGSIEGKAAYVKALREVVTRHPNTPEKARADEILRFLQGDKDAFTGVDIEEVDDIFSLEDERLHYVAIVTYGMSQDKVVNAKISVSNYNKEFHKLKKLQLGDSSLDIKKKTEIILVRRFENKEKAMEYYAEVDKAKEDFIPSELGAYSIYAISQRNYRKMVAEASDARYRVFFRKHYLGK